MVLDPLRWNEWWCDGVMVHLMNEIEVSCLCLIEL